MARDFDGNTDRIDYANVFDPSGSNLTVSLWAKTDIIGSTEYYFCIHKTGDSTFGIMLYQRTNGANKTLAITREWTGDVERRERWPGITTGTWQHMLATSTSSGLASGMECYIDGVVPANTATQTTSGTEEAHGGTWSLGGRVIDNLRNFDGKLAEIGVWDRILAAGEIAALAKRFSPQFFLRGLRFYTPLIGRKDTDRVAGKTPTYDGTTIADHPRIIYPG